MANVQTFTSSLITRVESSTSNKSSNTAYQGYYGEEYKANISNVGVIAFSGMNLANKHITQIVLNITSAQSGTGSTKTLFFNQSTRQGIVSGVSGAAYVGTAIGSVDGVFYRNTTSVTFSVSQNSTAFAAMAAYFAAGNNTLVLFDAQHRQTHSGAYSDNYAQLSTVTATITYDEGRSQPSVSSSNINIGSAVTIYTNRLNPNVTHTISYSFVGAVSTIAINVGDSVSWTPPLQLAQQIPSSTSGICTITCDTYLDGVLLGSATCSLILNVPSSMVPSISNIVITDPAGYYTQYGLYLKGKSKLGVTITAAGSYGSTIVNYASSVNGESFSSATFTTSTLKTSGVNTLTVVVTDSRGETATTTRTITVSDYVPPTITLFSAGRSNSTGTQPKPDGNNIRVSIGAAFSIFEDMTGVSCHVQYRVSGTSSWSTSSLSVPISNRTVSVTDQVLPETFSNLNSFDFQVVITGSIVSVSAGVSVGTKNVPLDIHAGGDGVAIGKISTKSNVFDIGYEIELDHALAVDYGGTGAATAAEARTNLGITPENIGAANEDHVHNASDITGGTFPNRLKFAQGADGILDLVGDTGRVSRSFPNNSETAVFSITANASSIAILYANVSFPTGTGGTFRFGAIHVTHNGVKTEVCAQTCPPQNNAGPRLSMFGVAQVQSGDTIDLSVNQNSGAAVNGTYQFGMFTFYGGTP